MNYFKTIAWPIAALKSSLAFRAIAFGYANARVKAMKESLLQEKDFARIASAKDASEIIVLLEKTSFRDSLLEQSIAIDKADFVEMALARNLEKTVEKIKKFSPKEMRKELSSILQRFDMQNIKTILLSKHLGKKPEEIAPFLLLAGAMPKQKVLYLLSLESVEKIVAFLEKTSFAGLIAGQLEEYKKTASIQPMLNELDKHYLSSLVKEFNSRHDADRTLLELLKAEIDAKNVSSILRAKNNEIPVAELEHSIIPNGGITAETLQKATRAKNVGEAIRVLEREIDFGKAKEKFEKDNKLSHFENALAARKKKKSLSVLRICNLSAAAILGFILLKEHEISTIRKIIRQKEFNLTQQEMQEQEAL